MITGVRKLAVRRPPVSRSHKCSFVGSSARIVDRAISLGVGNDCRRIATRKFTFEGSDHIQCGCAGSNFCPEVEAASLAKRLSQWLLARAILRRRWNSETSWLWGILALELIHFRTIND